MPRHLTEHPQRREFRPTVHVRLAHALVTAVESVAHVICMHDDAFSRWFGFAAVGWGEAPCVDGKIRVLYNVLVGGNGSMYD